MDKTLIRRTEPRDTAQIYLPDGRTYEGPVGTRLESFIKVACTQKEAPVVAALVNREIRDLCAPILHDSEVIPLTTATSDGLRILQRSLSFLLIVAAKELFPDTQVLVDHSLTLSGLYCRVIGRDPLTPDEIGALESRMREIAEADERIEKERLPLDQAKAVFAAQGYADKVRLLDYRSKDHLSVYRLRGITDYFYGYLVPATGYLRTFALQSYPPGFILRFPRRENPLALPSFHDSPKLAAVFSEHVTWMDLLGIGSVAALNEAVESQKIREAILVSEALHEDRIAGIAHNIADLRPNVRLVLIAGPTSSGKTTFSKRLAVQLLAHGVHPFTLAMDDYFVDRHETPVDSSGAYDFESLDALDRGLLNRQLLQLFRGAEVVLPHYDFRLGRREDGPKVRLKDDQIIIAEGIHGLNPELLPDLPAGSVYRVYASALTQLNLDRHNRIPTTDTRLLRRLVRDARTRGYDAANTISRWNSVTRSEAMRIFPFQENADAMFNSSLVYELAVLKPYAEPLLRQVEPGTLEYVEAKRLLAFLQWFLPCKPDLVPDNSILREFIGDSILADYTP
jgi:uridine kinase